MSMLSVGKKLFLGFGVAILLMIDILAVTVVTSLARDRQLTRNGDLSGLTSEIAHFTNSYMRANAEANVMLLTADSDGEYFRVVTYLEESADALGKMAVYSETLEDFGSDNFGELRSQYDRVLYNVREAHATNRRVREAGDALIKAGDEMQDALSALYTGALSTATEGGRSAEAEAESDLFETVLQPVRQASLQVNEMRLLARSTLLARDTTSVSQINAVLSGLVSTIEAVSRHIDSASVRDACRRTLEALEEYRVRVENMDSTVRGNKARVATAAAAFTAMTSVVDELNDAIARDANDSLTGTIRAERQEMWFLAGIVAFAILVSLFTALFIAREVRESEAQVRLVLDASPLSCSLRDERSVVLDCNRETLSMFGLSDKQEFLRRYHSLCPDTQPDGSDSAAQAEAYAREAMQTGYRRYLWTYRTASGEPLPVETTLVRLPWKSGYLLADYARDLREELARERQVREADERARALEVQTLAAQAASESKSQFLASMSHEIRTPMNAIIGLSEMMRTDNLTEEQRSFFTDIRRMSRVLLQIINDILDFSKIEAGRMDLVPDHFNLEELCINVTSLNRFTAERKGLSFSYSFAPDVPRVVYGDDVRIQQVITNIVNNAVKYTREGSVSLRVERREEGGRDYIAFVVADTGIGIKKEDFAKLFGTFEQLDTKKNHGITGTGLGLAITNRLIGMMDGKIQVESEYGKGSVFTILLPLEQGDPDKVKKGGLSGMVTVTGRVDVLVVDDNVINLKVALVYLSKCGIRADAADSGEAALKMVRNKHYDLVFMDHMMPEMDGLEATARIRALDDDWCRQMPIVAFTANAVSGAREMFLESGMNDFISKPIDAGELNRTLAAWLPADRVRPATPPPEAPPALPADREAGLAGAVDGEDLYRQALGGFRAEHGADLQKLRDLGTLPK
ncbi:MAG: response regulator [Oscillospiraceae bacterium]|nr:response regulator [Oscillospiraceae bacterium]